MKKLENLKDIIDSSLEGVDMSPEAKNRLRSSTSGKHRVLSPGILKYIAPPAVAVVVAFILIFNNFFGGPAVKVYAQNLMEGIAPNKVNRTILGDDFIKSTADFSMEVFKQNLSKGENTLISPTSVYLALGMTANGANGNTLKEFEKVLGRYGLDINKLNESYYSLSEQLTDTETEKMNIANSIWYRDDKSISISKDFLQTNADYYGASAYKADFNSTKTVEDINNWVKTNTGGLIDKIVDDIHPNSVMYLINALYFNGEWAVKYEDTWVSKNTFNLENGSAVRVDFMRSPENMYFNSNKAEGFIKPYKGGKYSFVGILPRKGTSLDSLLSSLSGEDLLKLINSAKRENVSVSLPKFKIEDTKELKDPLVRMGLKACFGGADFSRMEEPNSDNDLFVSSVLHKTFIQVDEAGTKAGAVTKVEMRAKSAAPVEMKSIILDRPFLYAIIDNQTNLPIFLGTMYNPSK